MLNLNPQRIPGCSRAVPIIAALACAALIAACAAPARRGLASGARFKLETPAFLSGGFVPRRYTCSGEDVSPPLHWSGAPAGARSFALIVTDPDAPGGTWVHWVAFNLPPGEHSLPEGVPRGDTIRGGGVQGVNDFRFNGYGGPCPPPGAPHHYLLRLYALRVRLPLKPGATRDDVEAAMKGHIIADTELVGRFGR